MLMIVLIATVESYLRISQS